MALYLSNVFLKVLSPPTRSIAAAFTKAGSSLMGVEPVNLPPNMRVDAVANVSPTLPAGVFVAPTATVAGKVTLGKASSVWYSAVVVGAPHGGGVTLAAGASVGDAAVVKSGADVTSIGIDAHVGARCTVGEGVMLADGAVLGPNVVVGEGAKIGLRACVVGGSILEPGVSVGDGQLWSGSPAVYKRDLTAEELAEMVAEQKVMSEMTVAHYVECEKDYMEISDDKEEYQDSIERHPSYFQRIKPGDHDNMDFLGQGIPGLIMNSKLTQKDDHVNTYDPEWGQVLPEKVPITLEQFVAATNWDPNRPMEDPVPIDTTYTNDQDDPFVLPLQGGEKPPDAAATLAAGTPTASARPKKIAAK